ncbi:MAG TPA: hypothetical protein EYQ50_27395 [Verrucomicrobiales bacterium]|nr:hypothetical protein [Verrucomicrobiales bacterium]
MSLFSILLSSVILSIGEPFTGNHVAPDKDEVYLQETIRKIITEEPITSIAVLDKTVYVGSRHRLFKIEDDQLLRMSGFKEDVLRLISVSDALWVLASTGIHRFQKGDWTKISDLSASDLTLHLGEVVVSSGTGLWKLKDDKFQLMTDSRSPFSVQRLASHCETLYLMGAGRVTVFNGKEIGGKNVYDWASDQVWDWGSLPSRNTRDLLSQGSRLYLATDRGLGLLRGMSMTSIKGEQGLCYEDCTSLSEGFEGDLWIGTTRGAMRKTGEDYHYFAGQRWLPDDRVNGIATNDRTVYIATDKGVGIISYQPFTLHQKAGYYQKHLEDWGQKRLGFIHKLEWDSELKDYVREVSDNDGGYSGNYLAAQSYRYAVTKDPAARAEAVNTFQALLWLEAITGIPGFPARSIWAKGERGHQAMHGSGGPHAEWHDSQDGLFEWKGDTSSDEICSHYYSISLFLEHVAMGEEVEQAKRHLVRIASHLIDHGWKLIDRDGEPTRWGRWDPEYFQTEEGLYDRGLQCLQLLSFMKTATEFSEDPKYVQAYQDLVDLDYPSFTLRQRNTFPPDGVLHFLDELGLWSYWNLIRFETSPELRSAYRRSLERSYEIVRIEQNPWFNFLYGALTGNEIELQPSIAHLRDWPLDLRVWSYQNSHRADLDTPDGYVSYKAGTRTFSPRETEPMRWDHWAMQADGGTGGKDVADPSGWLLAYWMGRFHGYITAPKDTPESNPAYSAVADSKGKPGAADYVGPNRPPSHLFD